MKFFAEKECTLTINGFNRQEQMPYLETQGSKHAFIYVFLASLFEPLDCFPILFRNVPIISDTYYLVEYALYAGADVHLDEEKKTLELYCGISRNRIIPQYVINCRSALLAFTLHALKFGYAEMYYMLGGCAIGERNIDQHVKLWSAIGLNYKQDGYYIILKRFSDADSLKTSDFSFDFDTTMGSVAAIYCLRKGCVSRLENVSTRPEINSLIEFYNLCGTSMCRMGRTVFNADVTKLPSERVVYRVPDDIDEAIGWSCLAHALNQKAFVKGVFSDELVFKWLYEKSKGTIIREADGIRVENSNRDDLLCKEMTISASRHPDIGSDQQPILSVWASAFCERVTVSDSKFNDRFGYVEELEKAGYKGSASGEEMVLSYDGKGSRADTPLVLRARDLRGGFAALMGILVSGRNGSLMNFEQVKRGYSDVCNKLKLMGVQAKVEYPGSSDSVAVILKNSDGWYYMQKRTPDASKNPNKITFFGGGVEEGEDSETAAKRELTEELELEIDLTAVDAVSINKDLFSKTGTVYLFSAKVGTEIVKCHEGSICLYSREELLKQDLSMFARCVLESDMGIQG